MLYSNIYQIDSTIIDISENITSIEGQIDFQSNQIYILQNIVFENDDSNNFDSLIDIFDKAIAVGQIDIEGLNTNINTYSNLVVDVNTKLVDSMYNLDVIVNSNLDTFSNQVGDLKVSLLDSMNILDILVNDNLDTFSNQVENVRVDLLDSMDSLDGLVNTNVNSLTDYVNTNINSLTNYVDSNVNSLTDYVDSNMNTLESNVNLYVEFTADAIDTINDFHHTWDSNLIGHASNIQEILDHNENSWKTMQMQVAYLWYRVQQLEEKIGGSN
jgi:hypothetical protein